MLEHSKKITDYAHPKQIAKELVSPRDFLENIYDTTPDGIMVSDTKGYIIRVNRALEKMLGFTQEEIIGKHTGEMSPDDEQHIAIGIKMLTELRAEGCIKNFEAYWSRKDGSLCPIELNITLLRDREGNKAGSVAIIRDISERKKSAEALRESDERFRSLIEQANDAILFVDGNGTIQFWNQRAEELYGYTADEVLGKPHCIIVPKRFQEVHKKWMEIFSSGNEAAISGKIVQGIGTRKDGSEFYAETSTAILKQENEKLLVAIVRDITERKRSETELREAKEFLENVFRTSGDGLIVTDEAGYIKKANEKIIKLFGYTEEELVGMHTAELSPSYTDYPAEKNNPPIIEQLFERGFVENYVTEYKKKNGAVFPGEVNLISLRNTAGNVAGGICSIRDITERKSAEKHLKEAKEQLEKFIEDSLDPIIVSDSSGHVLNPNKALLEMLGYQETEVIGKMVDSLFVYEQGTYESTTGERIRITEDFFTKNSSWMAQLFRNGKIFNWETYYVHKSRKVVPTTQNITLIYDSNGKISRLFCIIRDLTMQKKAESELRISEARFRAIAESSIDAIVTADSKNTIMFCNQTAENMFGYSKEELIGQPANILVAESFKQQDKGSLENALRRGTPTLTGKTVEVLGMRKDKQEFPVEVSVTTYMIDDNTYFTSTMHDITERKKLEEKIRQSEKMEAIGTLAGGVAHDLNNILSAIVGYPDLLLLNIPEGNPLRKPLLSIKSSGEKAAAIVNDLLTLARRGVNVTDVVSLNDIITDYLSSQHHEKLRSFHPLVEIDVNLAPDILNIAGSPVHLSKTVMNLISNAAEAMPEGGKAIISTRNRYLDKPVKGYDTMKEGDYVVLTVKDTGSGISPEDLSKIFEPFYTKKIMGRSGTGLGLAVVWGTVQDHNGYIEVDSTLGNGTSFNIYFPATRTKIAAKTEALPIEKYSGQGENILVVDDAETQREIASNILEKLNYQVATVSSGEEAVEYLKSKPCDLIVLDMLMDPGIDGLETYKRILSIAPHQKAIIASGFSETEQVKETQRLGAGAYIKKPYTLEEIGMAVRTELAR